MKPFCVLLQVCCVAVCLGVEPGSSAKPRDKEPVYRGKTLSQWAHRAKDRDSWMRQEAAAALGKMGPAATAALTEMFKDDDVFVRDAAAKAMKEVGPTTIPALTALLRDKDDNVRWAAADALGYQGPKAKTAVPALAELLKDQNNNAQGAAASALRQIGPAAVPTIVKLLRSEDAEVRAEAARILGGIAPRQKRPLRPS